MIINLREDDEAYLALTLSTNIDKAIQQFITTKNGNYEVYLLEVTNSEKYYKFPYNGKDYIVLFEERASKLDVFFHLYHYYKDTNSNGWRFIHNLDKLPKNDGSTFSVVQTQSGTIIVKDKMC